MKTSSQVANLIKKELKEKFPSVKFSVYTSSYDCVRISWTGEPKQDDETIQNIIGKYKKGYFNGMEDIYEYTNVNDSIPQVNYIFTHRGINGAV